MRECGTRGTGAVKYIPHFGRGSSQGRQEISVDNMTRSENYQTERVLRPLQVTQRSGGGKVTSGRAISPARCPHRSTKKIGRECGECSGQQQRRRTALHLTYGGGARAPWQRFSLCGPGWNVREVNSHIVLDNSCRQRCRPAGEEHWSKNISPENEV